MSQVVPSVPDGTDDAPPSTRDHILTAALERFSEHGYRATSLNEIADDVGIRRPSLLHHFESKEALYREVLVGHFESWHALVDDAIDDGGGTGWPRVERVLLAAFRFFEEQPHFVRLIRHEAIDGGPVLAQELGAFLRPMFDRAAAFLESEMDAGRLRRYDARHLLLTGYGAILSWFSDAPLVAALVGGDPLDPAALRTQRRLVLDLFRAAVDPDYDRGASTGL